MADSSVAFENNLYQISWRYLVKWKMFPFKNLIFIFQFVWQRYDIVFRYRRYWQMSSLLEKNFRSIPPCSGYKKRIMKIVKSKANSDKSSQSKHRHSSNSSYHVCWATSNNNSQIAFRKAEIVVARIISCRPCCRRWLTLITKRFVLFFLLLL